MEIGILRKVIALGPKSLKEMTPIIILHFEILQLSSSQNLLREIRENHLPPNLSSL